MTTTNFPPAARTAHAIRPEFGPALPVYYGPRLDDGDSRVVLDDGRVCYVWHEGTGNHPYPVLCTELMALDAGDNIVRRRKAEEESTAGICAPALPRTSGPVLCDVPADGSEVGLYVEDGADCPHCGRVNEGVRPGRDHRCPHCGTVYCAS